MHLTAIALLAVVSPLAEPAWGAAREPIRKLLAERPRATLTVGILFTGEDPRTEVRAFRGEEAGGPGAAGDGIYEVGSVSKAFTGTLLAIAVLRGEVDLDAPAARSLPAELAPPTRDGRSITPLHLATHTSSLPRLPPGLGLLALLSGTPDDPYAAYGRENLAVTVRTLELPRPIGSRHEYSNFGAGLLGLTLVGAAGGGGMTAAGFESLLVDRLCDPLKLADTRITLGDAQRARFLAPGSGPATGWTFDALAACGAVRSTAGDLLEFADACLHGEFAEPFALAAQPWRDRGEGRHVGLGWHGTPLRPSPGKAGPMMIWHSGMTGGFAAFLGLVPETGAAVVVLVNEAAPVDGIGSEVLNAVPAS